MSKKADQVLKKLQMTLFDIGFKRPSKAVPPFIAKSRVAKTLQIVLLQATKDLWTGKPTEREKFAASLIEYYIQLLRMNRIAPENVLPYLRTHLTLYGKKKQLLTEGELRDWFNSEEVPTEIAARIFHRDVRQIQRWIDKGKLKQHRRGFVLVVELYLFSKKLRNVDRFEHVWKTYERLHKPRTKNWGPKSK